MDYFFWFYFTSLDTLIGFKMLKFCCFVLRKKLKTALLEKPLSLMTPLALFCQLIRLPLVFLVQVEDGFQFIGNLS